jgi:hypothetical protein
MVHPTAAAFPIRLYCRKKVQCTDVMDPTVRRFFPLRLWQAEEAEEEEGEEGCPERTKNLKVKEVTHVLDDKVRYNNHTLPYV